MGRRAQAFDGWGRRLFLWGSRRAVFCLLICLPLAACGARGISIEDAVDRSLVTGSIERQAAAPAADATRRSDEATIRNAVSSAIVEEAGDSGIGWANAETGSRGLISAISEDKRDGFLCRRFTAMRESYDGVALYRGETCLGSARLWVMQAFDRVE